MGDWNYGNDQFPDEEYTTTTVAWKGSCKQYAVTRVYKTLWVNPQPEKKIDKIVITNAGLEDTPVAVRAAPGDHAGDAAQGRPAARGRPRQG